MKACAQGNIEAAEILLSHGASPNITFENVTALRMTLEKRNTDLVKLLLKHPKIHIAQTTNPHGTHHYSKEDIENLGIALYKCNPGIHVKILELLKMNSASPYSVDSWAKRVLEIIEKYLKQGYYRSDSKMSEFAALMASTDDQAISLDVSHLQRIVFACIIRNLTHFTEFLLQLGFKANDEVSCEYIMKAQSKGSLQMLHVLLKYLPIDSLAERHISKSILQQVISRFTISKSKKRVQDCTEKDAMLKTVIQLILYKGVNIHVENSDGETALSCATREGNSSICQFIVEKGYNSAELVEQHAEQCKSALTTAVLNCNLEITQLMVKSGFCNDFHNFKFHELCKELLLKTNSPAETLKMIEYLLVLGIIEPHGSYEAGITPLHIAGYGNNLHMVSTLLGFYDKEHKCDIERVTYDKEWYNLFHSSTLLQLAVKCGHFQMALVLLEEGCSAFVLDDQNNSLVHLLGINVNKRGESDCRERVQLIDKLLKSGISINNINAEGMTPLLCAVVNSDAASVQILLDRGSECDTALPQSHSTYPGCTALHIACHTHQYSIVNTLLKAGASVTRKDASNRTALHYICKSTVKNVNERPPYEIVQYLLQAGVDDHAIDNAVHSNLCGIVHFLLSHDYDEDVSYKAIHKIMKCSHNKEQWEKTVESLFRKVGDIIMRHILRQSQQHETAGEDIVSLCVAVGNLSLYHTIFTPRKGEHQMNLNTERHLHVLIRSGSVDLTLLHYILERGADVNEVNNEGKTPAHVACENDQIKVLEILFNYGANVSVQDAYGWTSIHVCAMNQANKCLTFLLRHSKCVNQITTAQYCSIFPRSTALMMCLICYPFSRYLRIHPGYQYMLDLLLKHGADPNIADIKGNNALHIAVVRHFSISLVDKLVKRMRDINATNQKHQSALHLAMSGNLTILDECMTEFLLEEGCNPNLPMPALDLAVEGDTVLHLAVRSLRRDLAEVFLNNGSDLLAENSKGESPVFLLVDNGLDRNMICFLDLFLKAGASLPHMNMMTQHFKDETIDQQLLYLLLKSGCKISLDVTTDDYNPSTTAQKAMLKLILDHEDHPLSLETLSANAVRQVLKPNALYSINKLKVPLPLTNIIAMKDVTCPIEDDVESSDDPSDCESSDKKASEGGEFFFYDHYLDSSDDSNSSISWDDCNSDYDICNYVFNSEEEDCYKVPKIKRHNPY